jgi:hypothetical protein
MGGRRGPVGLFPGSRSFKEQKKRADSVRSEDACRRKGLDRRDAPNSGQIQEPFKTSGFRNTYRHLLESWTGRTGASRGFAFGYLLRELRCTRIRSVVLGQCTFWRSPPPNCLSKKVQEPRRRVSQKFDFRLYNDRISFRKKQKLGDALFSTSIHGDISSAHRAFSAPTACQPFRDSAFAPPG